MAKKGSDADRRLRQCERIGRALRLLGLIQSPGGGWNAQSLAKELGCSERTVYRDLQTLELAGVPYYWDDQAGSYRVRPGYKAPQIPSRPGKNPSPEALVDFSLQAAGRLMAEAEQMIDALGRLKQALHASDMSGQGPK
ncbi:HTH domain-containing protein [Paludisphaera sp.]|uniref:helix-turn-helix transcriptional regulator n=1 Tax=Paludisphaera sp. TaxID=2017432 RepID=UPI00301DE145